MLIRFRLVFITFKMQLLATRPSSGLSNIYPIGVEWEALLRSLEQVEQWVKY
jgi:hypothetical protein